MLRDVNGKAARLETQARESVLKFLRAASGGARGFSLRGVRPRANLADWMAARYVGRILARKLHGALLGGELKPRDLAAVFLTPPLPGARRPWEERYFKLDRRAAPARLETSKSQVI